MAINKTAAGTYAVNFRDQHGRRIQRTFEKHKDAADYEKEALAQLAKKEYVKPSDKTLREVAEDWYKRKADAGTYRRASPIDWKNHVENYIKPDLDDLKLYALDVERIEKVAAEWAKNVSPKMVNKVLTTLTSIVGLAKRYKLIKGNPAEEAERLKVATENEEDIEVAPDHVYSKAEIRKLIEGTDPGALDRLIVMGPALTGLRIDEWLGAHGQPSTSKPESSP